MDHQAFADGSIDLWNHVQVTSFLPEIFMPPGVSALSTICLEHTLDRVLQEMVSPLDSDLHKI